jgi:hypothetical protein
VRTRLAIFLVAVSTAAPAQQLGTLFHSPKEREALERARRGESAWQAATPSADPVVTGFVKRSDGKSTVFIDKRPYPARDPRMQGVLDPRIVERYEPIALPPAPPPKAAEPGNGALPEPARKDAPKRTAGSEEE